MYGVNGNFKTISGAHYRIHSFSVKESTNYFVNNLNIQGLFGSRCYFESSHFNTPAPAIRPLAMQAVNK